MLLAIACIINDISDMLDWHVYNKSTVHINYSCTHTK
jgi:hypothetical protein